MTANAGYRLADTSILSVTRVEAPVVVDSDAIDDRLAPTYGRVGMTRGKLEALAGVRSRRWWHEGQDYTDGAVEAGRRALDEAGIDPARVGVLINASVCRPHLEPSVASRVHHELGLAPGCLVFDVTNACLGFVNAMQVAGTMVETGQAEYALIVSSEGTRQPQERTLARLERGESTRAEVREAFATLTVGSGAAGMVLGRSSAHPDGHRVLGGVSRSGSAHHELCIGSMDAMKTDSRALYVEGLQLALDTWRDAEDDFDWRDMDAYIAHQTSTVHIRGLCEALELSRDKFPLTLREHGNTASVSVPFTLVEHLPQLKKGDRVLLMGIGSGLNTSFTELAW